MSTSNNSQASQAYRGNQPPETLGSEFNAQAYLVRQILATIRTSTLVVVKSCSNAGGVSQVGTVDVQPLINQTDGYGNAVPLGVIYACPYFRVQGGTNAFILDPQPDDVGIMIFSDRDMTKVVNALQAGQPPQSNPGSGRKFDLSDGLYLGGVLNGAPAQYVQFLVDQINITSTTGKVTLTDKAGSVINMNGDNTGSLTFATALNITSDLTTIDGAVQINGTVNTNSTITASGEVTGNGTPLSTHTHGGVTSGGADTGPPIP
jgi:hypothetical protein